MFFAANITFRRRRERERKAIARIEAKREVKTQSGPYFIFIVLKHFFQELRKRLEEEEMTDEEDIEECPKEPIFYDICKTENEQHKDNTKNSA